MIWAEGRLAEGKRCQEDRAAVVGCRHEQPPLCVPATRIPQCLPAAIGE